MAFLKFNKSELVNLAYSLKREVLLANKTGAYMNTSIIGCNTRRYHGLLAVTLDRFGGDKFLLLSSLDESLTVNGKRFNLGIHCYGDMYEPKGHKYIIDFVADPIPQITYKVGEVVLRKSFIMAPESDQILVRYELVESPAAAAIELKPFLAFRNIHALTTENPAARTASCSIANGVSFCMYSNFPNLNLQLSTGTAVFKDSPVWYKGVTYSDEYRRGFDCREDLFVPGYFSLNLKPGGAVVFSASISEENPRTFTAKFARIEQKTPEITTTKDQLVRCADLMICNHNARKKVAAGFSWLYTGLVRETLLVLPGLALYGKDDPKEFEEILDNLIADEQQRLFRRTTQVEAPLYLAVDLQKYIEYGAPAKKVWGKYGATVKGILESYLPGMRDEICMQPNGLLWAQKYRTALSWMNAYVDGVPVTERDGYQVETNAFWYNSICFALEMENRYGDRNGDFVTKWMPIARLVKDNFEPVFWNEQFGCLADYVNVGGQVMDIRPNQIYAVSVKNSPVSEDHFGSILRVVDSELLTSRGIRTLSPRDVKYHGVYEGPQPARDMAFHQGCAMPFLLEPYVDICFRVKGSAFQNKAEWLVEGFYKDLGKHGVGAFSELYDGDPPHEPHGAISSALSTAALLAVDYMINKNKNQSI